MKSVEDRGAAVIMAPAREMSTAASRIPAARGRIRSSPASGRRRSPAPLAARRKKAAARQANTTAPAKLASSLKELGITSHAAPTHSPAVPASSRVHFRFMGRKVSGSSAPPRPAPSPSASIARAGT